MRFIPKLTNKEIEENHHLYTQRRSFYISKGLDFEKVRGFVLDKAEPLEGRILEIGAGKGHTTVALAKAGYKFIAVDNDKESLKIAALNLAYEGLLSNVELQLMDAEALTFADNSFDNVVVVNLLHHMHDADKMLSQIDRVLRTGGKVVLADFNKKGLELIDSAHREEGGKHESSGVTEDRVYQYFDGLGYELQRHQDAFHWIIIGKKK